MNKKPINLEAEAFSTEDASLYLRMVWGLTYAPTTLSKLRSIGGGPSFYRIGNNGPVIYARQAIDSWVERRIGTEVNNVAQERSLGKQPPTGRHLAGHLSRKQQPHN